MFYGATPARAAIRRCTEICRLLRGDPWAEALARQPLAALHAMQSNFDEAYVLLDAAATTLAEFGPTVDAAASHSEAYAAILAGDLDRADRQLRTGRRVLIEMGERAVLASVEGYLGLVALAQGRPAEAERKARQCRRLASADDVSPQVLWRQVHARVLASRNSPRKARILAEEAAELAATTDQLNIRADALVDLAIVCKEGADPAGSTRAVEAAIDLYREKENIAGIELARQLVAGEGPALLVRPSV